MLLIISVLLILASDFRISHLPSGIYVRSIEIQGGHFKPKLPERSPRIAIFDFISMSRYIIFQSYLSLHHLRTSTLCITDIAKHDSSTTKLQYLIPDTHGKPLSRDGGSSRVPSGYLPGKKLDSNAHQNSLVLFSYRDINIS